MRRKRWRGLLLFLIWMICFQASGFAQESVPVMTGFGDGFLVFENGQGYFVDDAGSRTECDVPDAENVCFCRGMDDTLCWEDTEGSVYRSKDLTGSELLLRQMPPAAGFIRQQAADQIVFADGTIFSTDTKEKTILPVESVLIGAEVNDYMAVLAEQNGTLWIRRPGEDYTSVRYDSLYGVRVRLTDMAVLENTVYICGEKEDGSPFLAGSVMGGVWAEREIAAPEDNGMVTVPEGIPLCMTAAEEAETLVLGCSDGTVVVLPSCVKCSAVHKLADTAVTSIAAAGGSVGCIADGEFSVLNLNDIQQSENPEKDCPGGC